MSVASEMLSLNICSTNTDKMMDEIKEMDGEKELVDWKVEWRKSSCPGKVGKKKLNGKDVMKLETMRNLICLSGEPWKELAKR